MARASGHFESHSLWSPITVRWCLVPLLLGLPTSTAALALGGYWLATVAVTMALVPSAHTAATIGVIAAGNLMPQLIALVFNRLIFDVAKNASLERRRHIDSLKAKRIAETVEAEYVRRYSDMFHTTRALLAALSREIVVSPELRDQLRAHSRRLRTMLEQSTAANHPMMSVLRSVLDSAELRGADVELQLDGELPGLTAGR